MLEEECSRLLLKNALRSILAIMLLGVTSAWMMDEILNLGGTLLSRTVVLFSIGALLVFWPLRAHHPFDRLGVANHITMARGAMVLLLLGLVGADSTPQIEAAALGIAMFSSGLDAADGWAARRTQMSSAYGARFDMETDALLILTLSLLAWQFEKAGAWVLISGLIRYAFVVASWLLPWLQQPLPPSQRRKTVAAIQMVSLVIAIAPFVSSDVSVPLCACALAVLAWSFLVDIVALKRRSSDSTAVT
ncbi:CDP-alcohol phosphatidyltransferase family protein [Steroidobacter cummioxidans]|uniref:CDP-alcohol phosphatidyltransferase family protein n=1 Tax=Steroidobacter cummioxidans TaxID=1803913 RepID=UPI001379B2DB|nr:CDP-alcohol phosphatidyltransferase family protein [Steroidobacter cummioxidans]